MDSPFTNRTGGNAIWCRIAGGKIIRKADETTPGAVKVEKKRNGQGTGEYRWELHDDGVTGTIIGFERRTETFNGEDNTTLIVTLKHEKSGALVKVQLNQGQRYWRDFMYRLPNVDLRREIELRPYDFLPTGEEKQKIGLNVLHSGTKVDRAFSKENPGGVPPAVQVMYKGKERLDFTTQDQWLNDNVLIPANAKLAELLSIAGQSITNDPPGTYAKPVPAPAPADAPMEDDDLPF